MKKGWLFLLVFIIFLVAFVGCVTTFSKKEDKPKVVVVLKQLNTDYWKTMKYGAEKAFSDFHVKGEVIAPNSEYPPSKQIYLLKRSLKDPPDAIITAPINLSASIPVLMKYKNKHIPVLFVDTNAKWKDQTAYIGTNDYELGKKAGELLGSMLQPGNQVAIIRGMTQSSGTSDRIDGARAVLDAIGIEIVTVQDGYDELGHVQSAMRTILHDYPNIKGVLATDDVMALDALNVSEKEGYHIPIVGTDGFLKMMKAVEEGKLSASVAQNPFDIGYICVEQALKAIRGEYVDQEYNTGVSIIHQENSKSNINFLTEILRKTKSEDIFDSIDRLVSKIF